MRSVSTVRTTTIMTAELRGLPPQLLPVVVAAAVVPAVEGYWATYCDGPVGMLRHEQVSSPDERTSECVRVRALLLLIS